MSSDNITILLNQASSEDSEKQSQLVDAIYADLRRIAVNRLASESSKNAFTVTSLVHDAYLRLDQLKSIQWRNRRHFFGAASEAMRRILIDRARHFSNKNRSEAKSMLPLDEGIILSSVVPQELLDLDDALASLEQKDPDLAEIVKLKFYAGLSGKEVADLLDLSARTVDRKWKSARAWLLSEITA